MNNIELRIAQLEQENAKLRKALKAVEEEVEGYVDGAPDATSASKLANRVYEFIVTIKREIKL